MVDAIIRITTLLVAAVALVNIGYAVLISVRLARRIAQRHPGRALGLWLPAWRARMAGDLALDPRLHRPAHRDPSRRRPRRDAPTRPALRLVRDLGNARRPDRPLILMGAPKWPPYPQTFAAPRVNRGAAL